jgi:transcriptional regulator with XRE-family HTH domain/Zn-dependent peptidase ImmA (M78 family)
MQELGLNAAAIAASLGVSKTIVSEWLKGKKFPRPALLLRLGKLLTLSYSELVSSSGIAEPIVAYRKHGNAKVKAEDEKRAKGMGKAANLLVPYLPFGRLSAPARLISPRVEAAYVEEAALETRAAMGCVGKQVHFEDIISLFGELKTVLIPVLWGEKDSLDNALHVYLPDSQTTLVYLNLDTKLFDFKFWMLHELGHSKTSGLLNSTDAEKFSDAFASAILVPENIAIEEFDRLSEIPDMGARILRVLAVARELIVSPVTIAKRIDYIAHSRGGEELLGKAIFGANTNFNKEYRLVSSGIFSSDTPNAIDLIRISEEIFKSPFYAALRSYIAEHGESEGIVAASLGVGPADAKAILDALVRR